MAREKLSDAKVARLVKKAGCYGDGAGLWLLVKPSGAASWVHRYSRHGKAVAKGLGSYPVVTLERAREKHLTAQRALYEGHAPVEAMTFADALERYHTAHRADWGSGKHAEQWRVSLLQHAVPTIGGLACAAIGTDHVLSVLRPIWTSRRATASRIRQRIEAVLEFARVEEHRNGDNPARWRGHLEHQLARKAPRTQHHAALPYRELPDFMLRLAAIEGVTARAVEFAILTAARSSEVRGAQWPEIDFKGRLWTIPASRMKGSREHRVPLTTAAQRILEALPRDGDRIFPLGKNAMTGLAQTIRPGITLHGFRSCFSDWSAETTEFPSEVREMALAHAVGSKVEAAYRRGDMFEKRRALAEAWSNFAVSSC